MLAPWWLVTIGIVAGLATRNIVGGKAYGTVGDTLLGGTGAFSINWMLATLTHTTVSWSNSTLFTIWGAAALPLLAHLLARHQTARQLQCGSTSVSLLRKDLVELTGDSPLLPHLDSGYSVGEFPADSLHNVQQISSLYQT